MLPPPVPSPAPILSGVDAGEGTVGEAFAIAPDTFVVPGRWPARADEPGLLCRSLVVRSRATAVVDTVPAPLAADWLAAILALVEPAEVRWVVLTALDPARAGSVAELLAVCPRATLVVPGAGCRTLDLGGGEEVVVHDGTPPTTPGAEPPSPIAPPDRIVVEVPHRRVLWSDAVGGAYVGPATAVGLLTDRELRAGLAHRPRSVPAAELAHLARLDLRALASPVGPVARGAAVGRVLDLLADLLAAEARDAGGDDARSTTVADLLARLEPVPWTGSRPSR